MALYTAYRGLYQKILNQKDRDGNLEIPGSKGRNTSLNESSILNPAAREFELFSVNRQKLINERHNAVATKFWQQYSAPIEKSISQQTEAGSGSRNYEFVWLIDGQQKSKKGEFLGKWIFCSGEGGGFG